MTTDALDGHCRRTDRMMGQAIDVRWCTVTFGTRCPRRHDPPAARGVADDVERTGQL
jgi:hypothetical protein